MPHLLLVWEKGGDGKLQAENRRPPKTSHSKARLQRPCNPKNNRINEAQK